MNILQNKFIISDKDTFKIKGTTPIYKQDICKYDTRFSTPSMARKQSAFLKWKGYPVQITGMSIKNVKVLFWILNHCNCINSNGIKQQIVVKNLKTLLSENFEETSMAHYMIIWCHERVKLPVNVYSYVPSLLEIATMHGTSVKSK